MAWTYYASITIDHTQVQASAETYLRVPFYGGPNFATVANGGTLTNANGYDVIFSTDTAGASPLTFELEANSYDATTGAGLWWIQLPFPSTSVDTVIYVVYANSSITTYQGNTNATWGSDYNAVVHFNASGTQNDSTATGNNLPSTGGSPTYTAGLLGLAFDSGGSDYLYLTTMSGLASDGPCTLSAWYKLASPVVSGNVCIVGMGGNGATNCRALALPGAATFVVDTATVDPACALASSTNWVYMAIVIPASGTPNSMLVYINGVLQTTAGGNNTAFALTSAGSYLTVGCIPGAPGAGDFMAGLIDELRYAPSALDAGLIATDYAAQMPGTTFYTLGSQQPQVPGGTFVATASPTATFQPGIAQGSFVATADPLASFTGNLGGLLFVATSDPLGSFSGTTFDGNGTFTAPASPTASFVGYATSIVGSFVATADPTAEFQPLLGQVEGCASGDGIPDGSAGGSYGLAF